MDERRPVCIACIGDSLTEGRLHNYTYNCLPYGTILAELLNQHFAQASICASTSHTPSFRIRVFGYSGYVTERTRFKYRRISQLTATCTTETDAVNNPPFNAQIAIVLSGTNDLCVHSASRVIGSLCSLYDDLIQQGCSAIIPMTIPALGGSEAASRIQLEKRIVVNNWIKEWGAANRWEVVDLFSETSEACSLPFRTGQDSPGKRSSDDDSEAESSEAPRPTFERRAQEEAMLENLTPVQLRHDLTDDDLHFNEIGYNIMARLILPKLLKTIEDLTSQGH